MFNNLKSPKNFFVSLLCTCWAKHLQLEKKLLVRLFFCDYRYVSIKNVERDRRSSGNQLLFKTIVSSAVIKQWPLFLSCNYNKDASIAFAVSQWKKEEYLLFIEEKCVYVMNGKNVFKSNHDSVSTVENIKSIHEEADTRMILHANHASNSYDRILVASPDTVVFVLYISLEIRLMQGSIFWLVWKFSEKLLIPKLSEKTLWRQWMFAMLQLNCF